METRENFSEYYCLQGKLYMKLLKLRNHIENSLNLLNLSQRHLLRWSGFNCNSRGDILLDICGDILT